MVVSYKQLPLLSIFLFSYFFLVRSQSDQNFCLIRPPNCYPISIPVCGYPFNCNDFSCTRTSPNACFACQDPTIQSYIVGACPPYVNPNPGNNQPDQPPPPENEAEAENEIEVEDEFGTCPDLSVAIQVNGNFIEGMFCCEQQPVVCPTKSEPVCAILFECIGSTCQTTVDNACLACHDPNVQLYVPGDCADSFGPDLVTQTEANLENQSPLWSNWEVVKLSEEEFSLEEGEGFLNLPEAVRLWIWYHNHNL